jgi:enamine deaminase RidA (YjgF/YER057c/UK114 family)
MSTTIDVIAALSRKGLLLPEPPKPGGAYESVNIVRGVAYVSIQFPFANGQMRYQGRLGRELTTQEGYQAAQLCALNVLAQVQRYVEFERLLGLNRIEAYMQTVEGWNGFPEVLDGASHLFLEALGQTGHHARSLAGVERLPLNASVALIASFTLQE